MGNLFQFGIPTQKNAHVAMIQALDSPDETEEPLAPPVATVAGSREYHAAQYEVTPLKRKGVDRSDLESAEKFRRQRSLNFKDVAAKCSKMLQSRVIEDPDALLQFPIRIGGRYFSRAIRQESEESEEAEEEKGNTMNLDFYSASGCSEEEEEGPKMEMGSPERTHPKSVEYQPVLAEQAVPEEDVLRAADQKAMRKKKKGADGKEKKTKRPKKGRKGKKGKKGKKSKKTRKSEKEVAPEAPPAREEPLPRNPQLVSKEDQLELREPLAALVRSYL